jgi:SAM-dependent methyltransferase
MKSVLKKILQQLKIYHPLQTFYRGWITAVTNHYYQFAYAKYKGKGFTCNFCNASYQQFVPEYPYAAIANAINSHEVIAGYGPNVYCPNCMSKNRERLVLAVLQHTITIENKKILHFSPEKNLHNYLATKATVTSVDIIPDFYKKIDSTITYADATNLQFENASFDIIIANHILEHIPADLTAMKEMHRVLRSGGVAILQVPYSEKLTATIEEPFIKNPIKQAYLFGQKDHVRIYALTDYVHRLTICGFTVTVLAPNMLAQFALHAIQAQESVILCYK